nr:unnamed protein product [Callosobruchus chinensis]
MLRDPAAGISENISLSDIRDCSNITSALKLRFGGAHLTELLYGQLHKPDTAIQGIYDHVRIRSTKIS